MSAADPLEIERTRTLLKSMLQRVPASVNAGSYDTAVAYKKLALKAGKLVAMAHPKHIDLQISYQALVQYN